MDEKEAFGGKNPTAFPGLNPLHEGVGGSNRYLPHPIIIGFPIEAPLGDSGDIDNVWYRQFTSRDIPPAASRKGQ